MFGLEPTGPHRALADTLFADMRIICVHCRGRSILIEQEDGGWSMCPWCEGTGGLWGVPWEDVGLIRQALLARYPAAAAQPLAVRFALEENELWE